MIRLVSAVTGRTVLLPEAWTDWTYRGREYRRREGVIETRVGRAWRAIGWHGERQRGGERD